MIFDASTYGTDGDAIQYAIDLALSAGEGRGGTVYVPRVRPHRAWVLTEPLRIAGGVRIVGDGASGAGHEWGGTILDARGAGCTAVEITNGRGLEMHSLSIKSDGHGIHLYPSATQKRTLSRLVFDTVSVEAGGVAFLMEGETDNDQCDTISLYDCQLKGEIGISSRSKQAVSVSMWGGSASGSLYCVDHQLGFLHLHGTNLHTQDGCQAALRQKGGQSHLTLSGGCYCECWSGHFLEIQGEHWRPTSIGVTRVIMQRGNTGRFIEAPFARNLRVTAEATFENDSQTFGTRPDRKPISVKIQAVRLGPGSQP